MGNSKNVDVTVVATLNPATGVEFECTWQDQSGVPQTGPIEFPFGASQNKVSFRLDDQTGLDLEFLDRPHEAAWFNVDSCPSHGNGTDLGQITDKAVEKDHGSSKRKKLKLTNLNTEECNLHYALRFTGNEAGNSAPPYVCDPELRNRGGGTL